LVQVPDAPYAVSWPFAAHALGGGLLQVTPRHGSFTQEPLRQPCEQVTADVEYEQVPFEQVPTPE
jgi:hypothetical protein